MNKGPNIATQVVRRGLLPGLIVALVLGASLLARPVGLFGLTPLSACSYGPGGAPNVTGVTPSNGPASGGTVVTITGCGFTGTVPATGVKFGTIVATGVVVHSDSSISATSPAEAAGIVHVRVTTPSGTSAPSPADQFTFAVFVCTSVSDSPSKSSPAMVGTTIVFTASAPSCPNPTFQFWTRAPGASLYTIAQPYSSTRTFTWNTTGKALGTWAITVWVRDASSPGRFSNSSGTWDAYNYLQFTLDSFCPSVSDSPSHSSPAMVGTTIVFTASASCPNPNFQFWTLAPGAGTYVKAQTYSPTRTFTWNTTGKAAGTWAITVWVRDASSAGRFGNSFGTWDAYSYMQFTLTTICPTVSDSPSQQSPVMVGSTVRFTAIGACPTPLYEFWTLAPGASQYVIGQPYSSTSTFDWSTTGKAVGTWAITVWVHDASDAGAFSNASGRWDAYNYMQFTLTAGCPSVSDAPSQPSPVARGTQVIFGASATGCATTPLFQFWVLAPGASYMVAQAYSSTSTFSWDTTGLAAGTYAITVWVRDSSHTGVFSNSSGNWDAYNYQQYVLT